MVPIFVIPFVINKSNTKRGNCSNQICPGFRTFSFVILFYVEMSMFFGPNFGPDFLGPISGPLLLLIKRLPPLVLFQETLQNSIGERGVAAPFLDLNGQSRGEKGRVVLDETKPMHPKSKSKIKKKRNYYNTLQNTR